ncbi:MAG: hypothetical protein M3Q44_06715 [bacterium]|nr:hypothetical protein [bacterium]
MSVQLELIKPAQFASDAFTVEGSTVTFRIPDDIVKQIERDAKGFKVVPSPDTVIEQNAVNSLGEVQTYRVISTNNIAYRGIPENRGFYPAQPTFEETRSAYRTHVWSRERRV